MRNQVRAVGYIALLLFSACGKHNDAPPPPEYHYSGPGNYDRARGEVSFPGQAQPDTSTIPVLSSTERAKYCSIYVEGETDEAAKQQFLADLNGTWERDLHQDGLGILFRPMARLSFSRSRTKAPLFPAVTC
jgi:hypothetical protein